MDYGKLISYSYKWTTLHDYREMNESKVSKTGNDWLRDLFFFLFFKIKYLCEWKKMSILKLIKKT